MVWNHCNKEKSLIIQPYLCTKHTRSNLGETQEEPGQESPHSVQNLRAPEAQASPTSQQQHPRVKWPPASRKNEWCQFDEDVDSTLEATTKGGADRRLKTMTTIIVSLATERFGTVEKRVTKSKYTKNHRAEKITQLRQELRLLKRQFKKAS